MPFENHLLKTLKEKIRYSEIEIDILKKMKIDLDFKNKKLHLDNRKLKERIRQLEKYCMKKKKN